SASRCSCESAQQRKVEERANPGLLLRLVKSEGRSGSTLTLSLEFRLFRRRDCWRVRGGSHAFSSQARQAGFLLALGVSPSLIKMFSPPVGFASTGIFCAG